MCRRGMWLRVPSGCKALQSQGRCSEPSTIQERWRVWGMLQSQVPRQKHMLKKGSDHNCNRWVPRWVLCQWARPLWPKWCSLWSHGYYWWEWAAEEPRRDPSHLSPVCRTVFHVCVLPCGLVFFDFWFRFANWTCHFILICQLINMYIYIWVLFLSFCFFKGVVY